MNIIDVKLFVPYGQSICEANTDALSLQNIQSPVDPTRGALVAPTFAVTKVFVRRGKYAS